MADNNVKNNDYKRDINRPSRNTVDRGGHLLNRQSEKSPFQKVLEETGSGTDFSNNSAPADQSTTHTVTREAVQGVASQQEKAGHEKESFQKRLSESEKEEGRGGDAKDSGSLRTKEADRKVIGQGSVSDRKGQGGGGGEGQGEGSGFGQRRGKGSALPMEGKMMRRGGVGETVRGKFSLEEAPLKKPLPAKAVKTPDILNNKQLLDQLVRYCRLVTKTDGDKEIDMQLHEEIFKGLKLRVSMVDGKVDATFITDSEEVKNLFQARKSDLRQALAEKGIEVRNINVIMV